MPNTHDISLYTKYLNVTRSTQSITNVKTMVKIKRWERNRYDNVWRTMMDYRDIQEDDGKVVNKSLRKLITLCSYRERARETKGSNWGM